MTDPATGISQPAADEALLEQLAEALRPPPLAPPPASVAALQREVERHWKPTVWARVTHQLASWARRLQRSGGAVALFGGLAVGGTGMALAAGGSTHQPVQHTFPDPGIPVLSPALQPNSPGLARPSVKARPSAALRSVPSTLSPRPARPLITTAASQVPVAPAPPARRASGGGTAARQSWPAPATYRRPPLAASGGTSGTCGAYGCASQPAPGAAYPTTARTAWSGAPSSGSGQTGSSWPQTSTGGSAPSTTTGSWDRRWPAGSLGDGAYAPTTRDGHTNW